MSNSDQYVQGDRKAKVKFYSFLILLVALYSYFQFFYEVSKPSVNNKQELDEYLRLQYFVWAVYAGIIWIGAAWIACFGLKIKHSKSYPPPDSVMPFKTKIRKGQYAKVAWVFTLAGASMMAVDPFLRLYVLYRLSEMAEMLN